MKRVGALLAIAGGVLALDQWTKHLATAALAGRPSVEVVGDFVRLTYALNSGVAFSLGAGSRFPFYLFSLAAALVILWLFARGRVARPGQRFALALILGGALGNLVDRITTGLVVDFIELGVGRFRWPVFNVADSAVSIGVVLFLFTGSVAASAVPAEYSAGEAPAPGAGEPQAAAHSDTFLETSDDDTNARARGDARRSGAAAGSLPRDGAGGPVA